MVRLPAARCCVIAALLAGACTNANPMAPSMAPAGPQAASAHDRFKGSCSSTFVEVVEFFGDPSNLRRFFADGTCQFGGVGRTTLTASQEVTFTSTTTVSIVSSVTYDAGKGDLLFARWSATGTVTATVMTYSGTETYQGGTGRFVDASGSSTVSGTAAFTSRTGSYSIDGRLN